MHRYIQVWTVKTRLSDRDSKNLPICHKPVLMDRIHIQYLFTWPDQRQDRYDLHLDKSTLCICNEPAGTPHWARLEFHQCPSCPLDRETTPFCPLSLQLTSLIDIFNNATSHDHLKVEVVTEERSVYKQTTAQRAISSLLGLIIPTSGCPKSRFLRPMARFHLPLATEQETIYRVAGMYLLSQYFLNKSGKTADLDLSGLRDLYGQLHEINTYCAQRLRDAADNDSTVNAVILLDMFSKAIPYAIEESLEELRDLFNPFFDSPGGG